MLDSLRFVQGAVAKKDIVAALTHFQIKDGTVRGHNGGLTLCSPIDLNLNVTPKGTMFVKAIQTCQEVISLSVTAGGRLSIKSGKFRALVDCVEEGFPATDPEGTVIELKTGGIIKALKTLLPFIAEDASRPWARGILIRGQSAFATNNVILAEYWLGYQFPCEVNIPKAAVVEMCRIGQEPIRMQVCENSVTFFFEGDRWLKTNLYSLEWPDLAKVLNRDSNPVAVPEGLWQALNDIAPFTDKSRRVYFLESGKVTTDPTEQTGAAVEVPGLAPTGVYNVDYLLAMEDVIEKVDFSTYPGPAMFFGKGIRGAIIGMRA